MDDVMADCGGGDAGAGQSMAEADGEERSCWLILRQQKMRLCVSYFVSVFTFLVRATMITRTGYFAHIYSLQMPEYAQNKEG